MSHRERVIQKRMWDADLGSYSGEEGDPRNDGRDADEVYEDEVNAARFAEQMRRARGRVDWRGEPIND